MYLIPPGQSVLEIGCACGELLNAVSPARGVGVDFSKEMASCAKKNYPKLEIILAEASEFRTEEKFDAIILSDLLNDLWDVQELFSHMKSWCHSDTRIMINSFSRVWQLPLNIARRHGFATPNLPQNWLTRDDIFNLLNIEGYEPIVSTGEILLPAKIPILQNLCNRYLSKIFPLNLLTLTQFIVARFPMTSLPKKPTTSVVIAARNEEGNVPHIFERIPKMGGGTELIFVEGGSTDDTYMAIKREIDRRPNVNAKLFRQSGIGKGDAIRKGFSEATGDILMILDADLTVAPEDLPRFFDVIIEGKAEYVNGVRLVYPMQDKAMRFLNLLGNKLFSIAFSWLLNRPIKDTLCGTKVMTKRNYEKIEKNRTYFGDFDPFGDFDLIFGAAKLNLKFVDLPIRYRERIYGDTNISRWSHGWLLIKMCFFAMEKIKFI
jgi:ubiquinone/menaquinone biosynthesis C-methylase UbiE